MVAEPPRVRRFTPPSRDEVAASRLEAEQMRRARDVAAAALAPAKRAAVASGPAVRDLEAAVACVCSCHPRPAQSDLHAGGVSCSCQLTPTERAAAWEAFTQSVGAWGDDGIDADAAFDLTATAAELGVSASVIVHGAPFVISGTCDGRGFYLRERGGTWRVTIASDDDPSADPWTLDIEQQTVDIATGSEDELCEDGARFSPQRALRVAVEAVRNALLRDSCAHESPLDDLHRFCRRCGVPLADADRWRWSS